MAIAPVIIGIKTSHSFCVSTQRRVLSYYSASDFIRQPLCFYLLKRENAPRQPIVLRREDYEIQPQPLGVFHGVFGAA